MQSLGSAMATLLVLLFALQWAKGQDLSDGLRLELIHRDSILESQPSFSDRLIQARERSRVRAKLLRPAMASKLNNSSTSYTSRLRASSGEYLLELSLGTPPQKSLLILDTGSDKIWLQCSPCKCVNQIGDLFTPSKSSSFKKYSCSDAVCTLATENGVSACTKEKKCSYHSDYADNSLSEGVFVSDTLTLTSITGSEVKFPGFSFGCGTNQSGDFSKASGIVGFDNYSISFPSQVGARIGHKFAYCLVSFEKAVTKTSPLYFGSAADIRSREAKTIKISEGPIPSLYYLDLQGISVGGKKLQISNSSFQVDGAGSGGTVIDSGTPISTFTPTTIYYKIKSAFESAISLPKVKTSKTSDLCFNTTGVKINVPSLTLHFNNADFSPPVENYFSINSSIGCLQLGPGIYGYPSMIGSMLHQNFLVSYDVAKSSLSFLEAQCDAL